MRETTRQMNARYKREDKERAAAALKKVTDILTQYPLPKEYKVEPKDFLYTQGRKMKSIGDYVSTFTLHYCERFGWVMAVLLISKAGRRSAPGAADRTYAIMLKDGSMCRVGLGPHVKATLTYHIYEGREAVTQELHDLYDEGSSKANETRDVISTRRMRGAMRRMW